MAIIVVVAEVCARRRRRLPPRDVPRVITWAVVTSGLLIVVADWLFSFILVTVGLATNGIEVVATAAATVAASSAASNATALAANATAAAAVAATEL